MTPEPQIVLHAGQRSLPIDASRVYFAFGSGRLGYDCVSCGAKCCRGFGYNVHADTELASQLAANPTVRFFLDRESASAPGQLLMSNCAPGCFFLTGDGRCGIQAVSGYDAKPETCRLFPFNNVFLVGDHLLVTPHTSLCPLQIQQAGDLSPASSHSQLTRELARHGVRARLSVLEPVNGDVRALVALERDLVEASERHIIDGGSYEEFVVEQRAATFCAGSPDVDPGLARRRAEGDMRRFQASLQAVLDYRTSAIGVTAAVSRTMLACTPTLRALLVFVNRDHAGLGLERTPHWLAALHAFVTMAVEAGMGEVTFQTVMALAVKHRELLHLLAHVDDEMTLGLSATVDWPIPGSRRFRSQYLRVARGLISSTRGRRKTLAQILCDELTVDGVERILLLKELSRRFLGRLVPARGPIDHRRPGPPRRFRSILQKAVLERVDPELLISATMLAERASEPS